MFTLLEKSYEFFSQFPIWTFIAFLSVIVCLRSQATHWIGRGMANWTENKTALAQSGWKYRLHKKLSTLNMQRGMDAIEKWGLIIVPLSFLTWGFQTLVHMGAGVLRVNWFYYTLAAIPGYIAWGAIYGTVGIAALKTVTSASQGQFWAVAVLTASVALIAAFIVFRRFYKSSRANRAAAPESLEPVAA